MPPQFIPTETTETTETTIWGALLVPGVIVAIMIGLTGSWAIITNTKFMIVAAIIIFVLFLFVRKVI